MNLRSYSLNELLPSYLTDTAKGRIQDALGQFSEDNSNTIDYTGFYSYEKQALLIQSDVVHSIPGIDWDTNTKQFISGFIPAILISNSCDVSLENERSLNNKEALFAPIVPVKDYVELGNRKGYSNSQLDSFYTTLKKQAYTNLLYLPQNEINSQEYIVRLDKINWVPQTELMEIIHDLENKRFISLSDWGYYLFITKLSIHLCRVPEEIERRVKYQ